jgi:cell division protein FtsQ
MRRLISPKPLVWTAAAVIGVGGAIALKLAVPAASLDQARARWHSTLIDISASLGLKLDALTVEGRSMTAPEELLSALDAERGMPILSIDVAHARSAIEALPWVRTAKVERRLPGTVHIQIEERTPYALWQRAGRYTLVDREGKTLVDVPAADASLPLIVGPDAPPHAAALFEALNTEADLAARVRAAVRVGQRRWNVYLDTFEGGTAIRLPEDDIAAAWSRLAGLERAHQLLERDLDFIDLRIADRLVVRVRKDSAAASADPKAKPASAPGKSI